MKPQEASCNYLMPNLNGNKICGAYNKSKRKDGRTWAHYPECQSENCPLQHPELLEDATLEKE